MILTAALYAAVLLIAAVEDFKIVAVGGFLVHLPLAAIEAVIVGFTCGYLARVKPQLLHPQERSSAQPRDRVDATL